MTKVLRKTFAALEYVARSGGPVLPDELRRALDILQPAAARLLRELAGGETALWDIEGKALNVPVWQLLIPLAAYSAYC